MKSLINPLKIIKAYCKVEKDLSYSYSEFQNAPSIRTVLSSGWRLLKGCGQVFLGGWTSLRLVAVIWKIEAR
jgi:hypothetical protein